MLRLAADYFMGFALSGSQGRKTEGKKERKKAEGSERVGRGDEEAIFNAFLGICRK
jgi:hypothetical protein